MGKLATQVQDYLHDALAAERTELDWQTEYHIAGTPVDVAGVNGDRLVLVELEWRRADPADNAAKLFRHLDSGTVDSEQVLVCQVFTGYYDLASGGVSSKRKNAEFVGRVAADTLDRLAYRPVELALDPPKRGGELPDDWEAVADGTVTVIRELVGAGD